MKASLALPLTVLILSAETAPERVDWARLRGLNYKTGRINADAKALDGAEVRMVGYVVPFEDEQNQVTEFLLVGINGACVHVPPPPPNQIVMVQMAAGKKAKVFWQQPVWVIGEMHIESSKSPYGDVYYRMVATGVELAKDI